MIRFVSLAAADWSPRAGLPVVLAFVAACGTASPGGSAKPATPTLIPASASPLVSSKTATCSSQQLSLSLDKFNAPDINGDRSAFLIVKNNSEHPCTMSGYPTIAPYDAAGRAIPVTLEHGGFGAQPIHDPGIQTVELAPQTAAYFGVQWFSSGGGPPYCTTSIQSKVTIPGDATPRSLQITLINVCAVGPNPGPLAVTAVATAAAFVGGTYTP